MVGERKLKFSKAVVEYLGLSKSDIGRDGKGTNGLCMGIDASAKELVIFVGPKNSSRLVGGSLEHPEVYCADLCKDMLGIMGKRLVREGTVNFTEVVEDKFDDDGSKCIVVKLDKYSANIGVFVEENVEEEA